MLNDVKEYFFNLGVKTGRKQQRTLINMRCQIFLSQH